MTSLLPHSARKMAGLEALRLGTEKNRESTGARNPRRKARDEEGAADSFTKTTDFKMPPDLGQDSVSFEETPLISLKVLKKKSLGTHSRDRSLF